MGVPAVVGERAAEGVEPEAAAAVAWAVAGLEVEAGGSEAEAVGSVVAAWGAAVAEGGAAEVLVEVEAGSVGAPEAGRGTGGAWSCPSRYSIGTCTSAAA